MKNSEYILKLNDRKNELYRICNYHGIRDDDAKDIIQEMYIKIMLYKNIDKYTMDNGEPNMYIIFAILRNLIYDKFNKDKKLRTEELSNMEIVEDEPFENEKYDFILNEIEHVEYWFDRNIIKLYINENHTLRSLAKETKIGIHFLHPVIYNFKEMCKIKYDQLKNKNNN